jgi:hypothetical protein
LSAARAMHLVAHRSSSFTDVSMEMYPKLNSLLFKF